MKKLVKITVIIISGSLFSACGGGGGSAPATTTTTSSLSFPVAQAIANFVSASHNYNYSMTGTENGTSVTGTGTVSYSAAVNSTFEGQVALAQSGTISGTISGNGNTVPYAFSGTDFYTTNYGWLGNSGSGSYCVARTTQSFPSSAKVGDTAILGTNDCYQDSTKNIKTETDEDSYVVEADTSTTALFNEITNTYSLTNNLQSTTQLRWRIDQLGNVNFASVTVTDYTVSPASVLTFTAN